jgi:hypothetical protein
VTTFIHEPPAQAELALLASNAELAQLLRRITPERVRAFDPAWVTAILNEAARRLERADTERRRVEAGARAVRAAQGAAENAQRRQQMAVRRRVRAFNETGLLVAMAMRDHPERPYEVHYTCHHCAADFTVMQGEPGQDEDIGLCWDCIDKLFDEDE